jgi:hypothetical protein
MRSPEYLEIKKDYARFRPEGEVSLDKAVALIGEAIRFCHDEEIRRLLVDTTQLTGFPPPTIAERYWMAQQWALQARAKVAVGMVVPSEVIDPGRFEVIAAENAGQTANVFTSEAEAMEWLLRQKME